VIGIVGYDEIQFRAFAERSFRELFVLEGKKIGCGPAQRPDPDRDGRDTTRFFSGRDLYDLIHNIPDEGGGGHRGFSRDVRIDPGFAGAKRATVGSGSA
jgi:hypothetical protein